MTRASHSLEILMDKTLLDSEDLPKHFLPLRDLKIEKNAPNPTPETFLRWQPPNLLPGSNGSESEGGAEQRTLEDLLSRPQLLRPLLVSITPKERGKGSRALRDSEYACQYARDWAPYQLTAVGVHGSDPFVVVLPFMFRFNPPPIDTLPTSLVLYLQQNLGNPDEYEYRVKRQKARSENQNPRLGRLVPTVRGRHTTSCRPSGGHERHCEGIACEG
jgi:hypothetical protein